MLRPFDAEYPSQQLMKMEQVIQDACADCPEVFRSEAYEVASIISALDSNPVSAIEDPAARTLVTRISQVGFVADYYWGVVKPSNGVDAEACRSSLPSWQQPEFLDEQGIRALPKGQINHDSGIISEGYQQFVERNRLDLRTHSRDGDYYGKPDAQPKAPSALSYKVYVEGGVLQNRLMDGGLQVAYDVLAQDGIAPYAMKLWDDERVVLYFSPTSEDDVAQVEKTLRTLNIAYRGPAQDVWQIDEDEDRSPRIHSVESNDNAVRERAVGRSRFSPRAYNQATFLRQYLQQCAMWGKSPMDIYTTSFVVARLEPDDPRLENDDFAAGILHLAHPYPVVIRPSPPGPPPLY
jgi:hypothetical protein